MMAATPDERTVVCSAHWQKDLFHTAPDSPCAVPADILQASASFAAAVWGLTVPCCVVVVAMLWRHGGMWTAHGMGYAALLFGVIFFCTAYAMIAEDMTASLANPRAAWRPLMLVGSLLGANVGSLAYLRRPFEQGAQFLSTLDPALYRQLMGWLHRGTSVWNFGWLVANTGIGIALFGAAQRVQDIGAALFLGGVALGLGMWGPGSFYASHLLSGLFHELGGTSSNSGMQVAHLRRFYRALGTVFTMIPLPYVVLVSMQSTRSVAGTIMTWVYGTGGFMIMTCIAMYEYHLHSPSHSRRVQVVPAAGKSTRFGYNKIASFAAATAKEIADDPQRRQQLLLRSSRRASLSPGVVQTNGVSLQLLRDFADEHGIGDSVTAGDVCAQHVKPMTAGVRAPLVTLLQDGRDTSGALWCGKPVRFISYAWSYPFRLLIDIVERFEEEHRPPRGETYYYFLDQFALNQHIFVDEHANQEELQQSIVATLESNMRHATHVLMCLHPWTRPVPLRRMWCLFELFVAIKNECKVTMCFGREDADSLYTAIQNSNFRAEDAVGMIDAASAGSSVASDKDMIMRLIGEQVGLERFNAEMREYLLKAFKTTVTSVLARARGGGNQRHDRQVAGSAAHAAHSPTVPMPSRGLDLAAPADAAVPRVSGDGLGGAALAGRVEALGSQLGSRMGTLEGQVCSIGDQVGSRINALETQVGSRINALEAQVASQSSSVSTRIAGLEEQIGVLMRMVGQMNSTLVAGRQMGADSNSRR